MTIDELKQQIEQRTGVPASLLNGETAEENIAQAKAMLAYKKQHEAERPKSNAEKFGEWFRAAQGIEEQDAAGAALQEVAEAYRVEAGGYPSVHDGGNPYINGKEAPDPRPAREQFAEWFSDKTAFNPFKDSDGWTKF